jgi:negative regulator of flagellin synthesis FlgM
MQGIGPTHLHGPQPISSPHSSRLAKPQPAAPPEQIRDEVNISDAASLVDQARNTPDVRQERIDAIRAQIAEGTYETPEKLDVALDRLLDEIA